MIRCAACGFENPSGMRFCGNCGQPLAAAPLARREERKVGSVVFADLVGFTSRSETADVEDVRAVLSPYHATVRTILERFGGTVEKFIGDAVMAVFGAPVAHEDDAERAVRAALAVRDELAQLPGELHVRIGVSSGEALVAVDARPELGEGMVSGDVVNTGARLQSAAPVDGVLVSEATYRATTRAIVYEEHPAVDAKGKALPVPCWVAVAPRALVPTADDDTVPLVGRSRERAALISALERSRAERSTQLVTVVGVPGIGKSRLVRELRGVIEAEPTLTTWREGSVRAYGEGVALRALADMVKQQCAILDSDDDATAETKIAAGVEAAGLSGGDASWTRRQLGALLGVPGGGESGGQQEASAGGGCSSRRSPTAARRCSCSRICSGPTRSCSISSTISSTAPATFRCWSSAPRARSCSSSGRHGAAARRTRSPCSCSRWRPTRSRR
jgi:class 3 adenylate cyclase